MPLRLDTIAGSPPMDGILQLEDELGSLLSPCGAQPTQSARRWTFLRRRGLLPTLCVCAAVVVAVWARLRPAPPGTVLPGAGAPAAGVLGLAEMRRPRGAGASEGAGGEEDPRAAVLRLAEARYSESAAQAFASFAKLSYCGPNPGVYAAAASMCSALGWLDGSVSVCDPAQFAVTPGTASILDRGR
mmetsp:Transcript_79369/g.256577  ORF Transcript_79369/g.256577 Transcript_79369/m.256577 type:complete len:187 (-) Transcript_79369:184-744(-)